MNEALTYDDVLLVPSYNHWESRKVVDTRVTDRIGLLSLDIPVMTSNMDTITESGMANFIRSKGGIGVLHRFMSVEDNVKLLKECNLPVFVSVGCSDDDLQRAEALRDSGAGFFCIDVAHAHAKYVGRTLKNLREMLGKETCIMAGNVATYAGADYLASCGADIVKVGIGGGSVCTTRIKTGFGVPNLTAIKDCSRVDRSLVADGGIRNPGDVVKALAFGADFVMIGSMLAGTRPTPGNVITRSTDDGRELKVKMYRGMASNEVHDDYHGGLAEWKTAEGISVEVEYRESEETIIADIVGGLRSGMTYAGASSIRELQRKLDYVRITNAARIENLPHRTIH
ncbi:MAG: guanosine monophosphate reductase [SAR324 cluster bacterium]|jgi:IMP dehydrogenase|nr:guanosine monophosphate reductase [Pseudomonadota bacterium]MBI13168.1 guanosine monophosphate reductase [Deltaproteobacteria bacterium]MDP6091529.1 guanosine monophosphate reductase [SAR324 cluster bacterium]MBP43486.1 guanosine monophosphate reductase [Deltaproteobacteria bacterium]MDP6245539.1 guanosine monophosphate reductase [SAR324 cluster bacterium]|tara:strand:+ start:8227 stop:9249 length:1023 start_codon:yes stop_codon:yes gene_type:complete